MKEKIGANERKKIGAEDNNTLLEWQFYYRKGITKLKQFKMVI